LATVTWALPAVAKSLAGTLAVNAVALAQFKGWSMFDELTQEVVSGVPFHSIETPSWKFEP
jgi:hypothetical protein